MTLGLLLVACAPVPVEAPATTNLAGLIQHKTGDAPPAGPEGVCWASDTTPAVIETTTEQVLIAPELRDEAGNVIRPASYRSETQQRMLHEREEVWFQSPCPEEMTVDFIATLQRALKARGLYLLPLTGEMDAPTREAIRRFQAERGLDSPVLSLAAAQELGIVATALDQL